MNRYVQMRGAALGPMIVLALLLLVCMMSFQYMMARFLYTEVEDKLTGMTERSAELVDSRIREAYAHLDSISSQLGGEEQVPDRSVEKLRLGNPQITRFQYLGAVSVQGKQLYGETLPIDYAILQDTFRGHAAVKCLEAGQLPRGQQALLFSVPIWKDGVVAGAVYGVLSGQTMKNLFAGAVFGGDGSTFGASRDFRLIGFFGGQTSVGKAAADFFSGDHDEVLQNLYRKLYYYNHGVEEFSYAGSNYYISSVALTEMDNWYINGVIPAEQTDKNMRLLLLSAAAAYAVLSLLFLAAFWVIGSNARKNQEKILQLAYRDETTGLWNWPKLQKDWDELAPGEGTILAVFDFDEFSLMNTILGREYCDWLLRQAAQIFRQVIQADEMLCCVRADRFLLCLKRETGKARLQGIMASVQAESNRYPVRLSCGISRFMPGRSVQSVYEEAVTALKHAKQGAGGGLAIYDQQMWQEQRMDKRLAADFQLALERHELKLYLQAKHYLQKDGWAGSEALVRWEHPEFGLLMPSAFIPVLEQNGDIGLLDDYMLEETCRAIRGWLDEGREVYPVSINLSRAHFAHQGLVESIQRTVERYQIPLPLLELEITESAFFQDEKQMLERIARLREAGFRLSIDDFGTGYSSLALLEKMSANVLKLDKSFVDNWDERPTSRLVRDIVQLARHFGMTIVIEGIETEKQAIRAMDAGCDIAQGYYYARPLSAREYEKLVYGGDAL